MVSRRAMIAGGAGAAVLAGLGYRAWDRGVFSPAQGEAFAPWAEWEGSGGDGIKRPLRAAILAANPHDTQPWLFEAKGDTITIWADRKRNLGSFDPFRREMHLGLGCAIANLEFAAWKLGYAQTLFTVDKRLTLSPPNTVSLAAALQLNRNGQTRLPAADELLFEAIPFRHTNRGAFLPGKPIDDRLLAKWRGAYADGTARIVFVTDPAGRSAMSNIIVEATQAIIGDPEMSADSARWFRTGRREVAAHRDGVTMDTAGLSPVLLAAAKLLPDVDSKTADKSWLSMTRDTQTATAVVFGMILVKDRLSVSQSLSAGRVWQKLHLAATAQGISAQPMNQPVEMVDRNLMLNRRDEFGPALAKLADMPGWEPTFTFRMGYAEREAGPSPRRPLAEVLRG